MTDPSSLSPDDILSHFEDVGSLSFDQEDGRTLGISMFVCQSCGSLIAVPRLHWATHQMLGIDQE